MLETKCPKCSCEFIKRVSRRSAGELLLSFLYIYPFRCHLCGHRFKLLRWRKVYHKAVYDRREFERLPVSLKTSIWAESGEHGEGIIEDLSVIECTLASDVPFREGSIVRLELYVPQIEAPIVVQAGVVRAIGTNHSQVEFLRMQHGERERLRVLIKDLLAERGASTNEKKAGTPTMGGD